METKLDLRKVEVIDRIELLYDKDGNVMYDDISQPMKNIYRKTVDIPWSTVRRYADCLGLLFGLTPCTRNLLDYLVEHAMDKDNIVVHTSYVRGKFIEFSKDELGVERYNDRRVYQSFEELVKTGFLIKKQRSVYQVSPMFFTKNIRHQDHERMIRLYFQFTAQKTIMSIEHTYNEQTIPEDYYEDEK